MNHSALELCRPVAWELAPFGTYLGSPTSHCRISTKLTGTCAVAKCSDSLYPSTGHDLWQQTVRSGFTTFSLVSVQILGCWVLLLKKLALNEAMQRWAGGVG